MSKIKVSIIVPLYKTAQVMDRCIQSIQNQSLKEIEIILVNDGSPDNAYEKALVYKQKDSRIKTYTKENSGLSDTRNIGIEKATGKYIAFVDSDDYINSDMLETMYNKAIEKDFDIVVCDMNYVYENNTKVSSSNVLHDIENLSMNKEVLTKIFPTACNKIYKKDLFKKVKFKTGVYFEDVEFIHKLFPHLRSIGVVSKPFYQYVQSTSIITKTFNHKLYDYLDNFNEIIHYYKQKGFYDAFHKEIEYCYIRYIYATMLKRMSNFEDKNEYRKAVNLAIESVKERFPKYKKNPYFYKSPKGIYLILFNRVIANALYSITKMSNSIKRQK